MHGRVQEVPSFGGATRGFWHSVGRGVTMPIESSKARLAKIARRPAENLPLPGVSAACPHGDRLVVVLCCVDWGLP